MQHIEKPLFSCFYLLCGYLFGWVQYRLWVLKKPLNQMIKRLFNLLTIIIEYQSLSYYLPETAFIRTDTTEIFATQYFNIRT